MSFSNEWNTIYAKNEQISIWPWSELVSTVMRLGLPSTSRVLELGCGPGANIPFFKHLGMDYHAIEGSDVIVKQLHDRFPEYASTIKCGDFTKGFPFEGEFDLIIDRASVTHNDTQNIKALIADAKQQLNPGGFYIGIDWFSTKHSDFMSGEEVDNFTRANCSGQFENCGMVHFSNKDHLEDLFKDFKIKSMTHKVVSEADDSHQVASWNVVCQN